VKETRIVEKEWGIFERVKVWAKRVEPARQGLDVDIKKSGGTPRQSCSAKN
jgi:hypothetical protein